ncbi:c-type heme family protein [Nitrospira sp. M1]
MRNYLLRFSTGVCAVTVGVALVIPFAQAGDISKGQAAEFILATAKAARTVYVKDIISNAKKGGVKPNEDWEKADHSVMLPAQFVKAVGSKIEGFELGLVGTDPLFPSNAPKTDAEKKALTELASGKKDVVTFEDGGQTVGMSADFAIVDGCADCHNQHPKTTKKDWKKGDFMGAIVVRMK